VAWLETPAGRVARIATITGWRERLGAWKVRWGIGRNSFIVPPGLYAIGHPGADDPVVVTANYQMTYDIVRRALADRSVWLLVLETYGINVWCAAGKGTFGTGELVRRVTSSGLARVVNHRRLILPILGAAGVAAHEVQRRCGFSVHYAAIRAADLPTYLDNGMVTTPDMQELTFTIRERLVLIPVEMVLASKAILLAGVTLFLLGAITGGFPLGITLAVALAGAALSGIVVGPLLLPWLPGRSFALKGASVGLAWSAIFCLLAGASWNLPATLATFLALPAVSAFYTLNFTGCTTFTSRSGVRKEMRLGLPAMAAAVVGGVILLVVGGMVR
jgi:acetyl-CoA decarbonylase/synthase complex subunit gamma